MKLEFRSSVPAAESFESVVIGGKTVGYVKGRIDREYGGRMPKTRYHAALYAFEGADGLIQGHGETREEAVLAAIEDGKRRAERMMQGSLALARALGVEG